MTTKTKRDLRADLAFCNKDSVVGAFVKEAREGWPEALRRAIAAEAEVESLRMQRDSLEATVQHYRGYA
ncbi:hypothetical protein MHB77_32550 [Paenibacillus sp. FSL K6-3166]|uniref:hypothetical protein n=1 Tax=unclassified Paenibacillus TaxID=185978 RepID=UPI000BA189A3|nr:hypothetical protein [Paenibacillus sp. VTT E-133291]OZQ84671.1 hypothetical protein CA598_23030 [Paenibacillus sp. VTT E-133291]